MLELLKDKRILVVVAHPDDEVLGLGGTLIQLSNYSKIKVVILGEGLTSRSDKRDLQKFEKELEIHRSNIYKAKSHIGYHEISIHNLPDNRFDSIPLLDVIKIIEKEIETFNPEIIITHHNGDLNIDHRITFKAVYTSCRPLPKNKIRLIITFETLSGTEWISSNDPRKFNPNFYFILNKEEIDKKILAMESYEFEKRAYPHPRSSQAIINRAKMWGNTVGEYYAEPFQIIRLVT